MNLSSLSPPFFQGKESNLQYCKCCTMPNSITLSWTEVKEMKQLASVTQNKFNKQYNQANPLSIVICCPCTYNSPNIFALSATLTLLLIQMRGDNDWPDDDEVSTRGDHHTLGNQQQDYRVMMQPRLCRTQDCMGLHGMTSPSTVR